MGELHTTFMKMLIKLIAIGLVLAVCSADFDDTPVSEEMILEEVDSTPEDSLVETSDTATNKAGWWVRRRKPNLYRQIKKFSRKKQQKAQPISPFSQKWNGRKFKKFKKKMKRSTYSKGRKKKWNGRKFRKFKTKMKRSTYSKGRKKKWNGRKFRKFKKKMKRSTYSKGRKKRGRK